VGEGYFFVWTVFGMAAFPLGVALAAVRLASRMVFVVLQIVHAVLPAL